jgi:tetratricopeptide (TPR) repeat protein
MNDLDTDLNALLLKTVNSPIEQDVIKLAAQIYSQQHDWSRSLAMLELVKDQDAGFEICRIVCTLRLGQADEGKKLIASALKSYPDNVRILTMQAARLVSDEDYYSAIECCNKVLKLEPSDLKAYLILAETYLCQENWQAALDTLQEAETACGQLDMIGENLRGAAAGQLGLHEIASLAFAKAVSYEENFYSGWFNLATALFRLERNEEAEMALARIPQWMLQQIVEENKVKEGSENT